MRSRIAGLRVDEVDGAARVHEHGLVLELAHRRGEARSRERLLGERVDPSGLQRRESARPRADPAHDRALVDRPRRAGATGEPEPVVGRRVAGRARARAAELADDAAVRSDLVEESAARATTIAPPVSATGPTKSPVDCHARVACLRVDRVDRARLTDEDHQAVRRDGCASKRVVLLHVPEHVPGRRVDRPHSAAAVRDIGSPGRVGGDRGFDRAIGGVGPASAAVVDVDRPDRAVVGAEHDRVVDDSGPCHRPRTEIALPSLFTGRRVDAERGAGFTRVRDDAAGDDRAGRDVVVGFDRPEEVAAAVERVEALVGGPRIQPSGLRIEPGAPYIEPPGWKRHCTTSGVSAASATRSPRSDATRIDGGSLGTNCAGNVGGEIDPVGVPLPTRPSESSPSGAGGDGTAAGGVGRPSSVNCVVPLVRTSMCWKSAPFSSRSSRSTMPMPAHATFWLRDVDSPTADETSNRRQSSNRSVLVRSRTFPSTVYSRVPRRPRRRPLLPDVELGRHDQRGRVERELAGRVGDREQPVADVVTRHDVRALSVGHDRAARVDRRGQLDAYGRVRHAGRHRVLVGSSVQIDQLRERGGREREERLAVAEHVSVRRFPARRRRRRGRAVDESAASPSISGR